jgi:medium-chain acyl-[acyl-carrier-protein] hydrolase
MQLFLPILRADPALHETCRYVPGEPLDCPISAFGGLEDAKVNRDNLAARREQTRAPFTLCIFPGDQLLPSGA